MESHVAECMISETQHQHLDNHGNGEAKERVAAKSLEAADKASMVWAAGWGRGRKRTLLAGLHVVTDAFIASFSLVVAYIMFSGWPASLALNELTLLSRFTQLPQVIISPEFSAYLPLFFLAAPIYVLLFQWLRLYQAIDHDGNPFSETGKILKGVLIATGLLYSIALTIGASMAQPLAHPHAPLLFVYQAMVAVWGLSLFHSATHILMLCLHHLGIGQRRVAILRGEEAAEKMRRAFANPIADCALIGEIALKTPETDSTQAALGHLDELQTLINRHNLDTLVLALDPGALSQEQRINMAQTCWKMGVQLKMVPPFEPFFRTSARPEAIGGITLLHIENLGLYATRAQLMKRAMDIFVSTTALIALSPLLILLAILIRLDSKGPVFFVQDRVGLNGRLFPMIKFRSMRTDADDAEHKKYLQELIKGNVAHALDEDGNPVYKIIDDPRITRLGKFIRKTSLDELPQLFNVFRGEMSLVGPRPPIQYEVDEYEDWHVRRLNIRPGITGLWQVSGRNRLSFEEMVQLDIQYIEHWSFLLDLKILFRTIPVVLKLDQAY